MATLLEYFHLNDVSILIKHQLKLVLVLVIMTAIVAINDLWDNDH